MEHNQLTSVLLTCMQLLVDGPTQSNVIYLPDASGIVAVAAEPPLYVDPDGSVYLEQAGIRQVGQLTTGSLGAGFGESSTGLVFVGEPLSPDMRCVCNPAIVLKTCDHSAFLCPT